MKLLFKSLAGGNFHLDIEPTETIERVKQKICDAQGHSVELQKLIFSGKILENSKTVESYVIQEKDFLVVMVSKPKTPKASKPEVSAEESKEVKGETQEAPAADAPKEVASASAPAPESDGTPLQASSFLAGSELEAAMTSMTEMGFPRTDVQRAMRMSFNNPDRAVEYLMNGLPAEAPSSEAPLEATETPAAAPANPAAAPAAPANPPAASGNLFEQAAAVASQGAQGSDLPGETDAQGRQMIDLGNPQVLGQLRSLVEQNPAALQPLIQALVQSNPQLAEAMSADPEGVLRLLAGAEAPDGDEESFEVPSLQQLSEEDRTQVQQNPQDFED
ncbi:UV excision repair protein rad23 [Malassezia vespertilionis]|uniref:UV excision repair protein rad23 n=1 Tax=Malassezia vespertilionis TaxID=2020962 RepID=UPI0024B0A069|nr:UV excision repair protein rad23 [Malassezia vespertilionis]WFD07944.1 UV excision repair protein rad23 [Malassezia vespertilionis]